MAPIHVFRKATTKDRVLQYGGVTFGLLKDIGNASNQPYLQAIASISLLIIETVQRVESNKDACMKMTERAHELVGAVINICSDSDAELSPDMVRSIEQFLETLQKILKFVRSQVKGSFVRRMLRSMEDADLITQCNSGLKHALDVFSVQSGIIAAKTMAEMQKEARVRHEELVKILEEKKSRKKSSSDSSRERRKSKMGLLLSLKTDLLPPAALLPASPKIFHGREEELKHVVETIVDPKAPPAIVVPTTPTHPWATWSPSMTTPVSPISPSYRPLTPWTPSTPTFTAATLPATPPATPTTGKPPAPPGPARITICGAPGIGKTALALAAAHHPRVAAKFDGRRYFVECESAEDPKALVACVAKALGLEGERVGRKHVVRFLKGEKDKAIGRRESVESSMDAAKDTVAPTPTRSDTTDSSTSSATAVSADSYATLADQQPEPEKKDPEPILLILDAIDRAWKPHINRNDVEDFLSLLADIQHLTLLVTLRGNERPRQIKWTRPFLPALKPLAKDAAQATFLDISDVPADDPDLQEVLEKLVQGCPRRLTTLAGLASFEGCGALVRRWEAEGEGMLVDRTTARTRENGILGGVVYDEPESFGEDGKMQLPDGLTEEDVWSVLDPTTRWAIGRAFPALIPAPSSDASSSSSSSGTSTPALSRSSSSASSSLNSAFSSSASTAAHSHSRAHSRTGSIFSSMFTPSRSSSKGSFSSSSSHSNHNHARYPSIDSILYALPSPPTTPPFSFSRLSESLPGRKQSEATPAALACLQSSALYPPSPAPASMQRLVGLVPPTTKVGGGEGEP